MSYSNTNYHARSVHTVFYVLRACVRPHKVIKVQFSETHSTSELIN